MIDEPGAKRRTQLEESVSMRVTQRTSGRIRALEVRESGCRMMVRGYAPSYYLKQLALQGVLDVLGRDGAYVVQFDVQVAPARAAAAEEQDRAEI